VYREGKIRDRRGNATYRVTDWDKIKTERETDRERDGERGNKRERDQKLNCRVDNLESWSNISRMRGAIRLEREE